MTLLASAVYRGLRGTAFSRRAEPAPAGRLRARHAAITPGYHLNKRHWNTVALDGSVPGEELAELVGHSCGQVVARLTRAQRNGLTG